MKIIYLGPCDRVNVAPHGEHFRDQVKEYPDAFAAELLDTSKKQKFEVVDDGTIAKTDQKPEGMTVAELTALLEKLEIKIPARSKKADLLKLLDEHTAEPPKDDE